MQKKIAERLLLALINSKGGITRKQALATYKVKNPSATIHDLREKGWKINSKYEMKMKTCVDGVKRPHVTVRYTITQ